MMEVRASDLHITANSPMQFRIDEKLAPVNDKILSPEDAKATILKIENAIKDFEDRKVSIKNNISVNQK